MEITEDAVETLVRRIDRLESLAAIQKLVAEYGHAFDREDEDLLRSIWHEDAIFDVGEYGHHEDRETIVTSSMELAKALPEQHHWQANVAIEFDPDDPDKATGLVALDGAVHAVEGGPHMIGGYYTDVYERRDGVWKFASRYYTAEYWSPIAGPLRTGSEAA